MTQALYAHMNNKKIKKNKDFGNTSESTYNLGHLLFCQLILKHKATISLFVDFLMTQFKKFSILLIHMIILSRQLFWNIFRMVAKLQR
jgi:hypothetical protein